MKETTADRLRAKRHKGDHGTKAEKLSAKKVDGRLTPASGAMESAKGDFEAGEFLVENKCTNSGTLSLKLEWLTKISRESSSLGKTPALAFQFVDSTGRPRTSGDWVAIPAWLWREMVNDI